MFTKQDSFKLEKFLQSESSLERREKQCQHHKEHCADCQLLLQSNNLKETNLIRAILNNIEARKQKDGTYLIRNNYIYRNDIKKTVCTRQIKHLSGKRSFTESNIKMQQKRTIGNLERTS